MVGDKLYMENTLLRVAGALFCHDAKRAPTHTEQIELNRGVAEKNIVIRPDPQARSARAAGAQDFRRAHQKAFRLRPPDPSRRVIHQARTDAPHRPRRVGRQRQRAARARPRRNSLRVRPHPLQIRRPFRRALVQYFSGDLSGAARARHRSDRGVHRDARAADHGVAAGRTFYLSQSRTDAAARHDRPGILHAALFSLRQSVRRPPPKAPDVRQALRRHLRRMAGRACGASRTSPSSSATSWARTCASS